MKQKLILLIAAAASLAIALIAVGSIDTASGSPKTA
jgi:hypothetical protein